DYKPYNCRRTIWREVILAPIRRLLPRTFVVLRDERALPQPQYLPGVNGLKISAIPGTLGARSSKSLFDCTRFKLNPSARPPIAPPDAFAPAIARDKIKWSGPEPYRNQHTNGAKASQRYPQLASRRRVHRKLLSWL